MDLSIVIPAWNEEQNLSELIPSVHGAASSLGLQYEIIIVNQASGSQTPGIDVARFASTRLIQQEAVGYGSAVLRGIAGARGEYILTMDADLSHDPSLLMAFWSARDQGEVILGSRYIAGGAAHVTAFRKILSRGLNFVFRRGLSLPWSDLSSGFRLYRASVVKPLKISGHDFDVLQELLIKCYAEGSRIHEIPIRYEPRRSGSTHVRLFRFGMSYLKTFYRMWKLRNSIDSADYDDRAFDSIIPVQRYWQRRRYSIIREFSAGGNRMLDIGCGSSRLLSASDSVWGLDIRLNKLRYARKFDCPLVNGSVFALPFLDESFDCVICSEVIEHVAAGEKPFLEMRRILKPGGTLVIGTPDYAHLSWRMIEAVYGVVVPGGYAEEHITHYTLESLSSVLQSLGFTIRKAEYICNSELILKCTYDPER